MRIVEERDLQTYAIIGATMEIHCQLGHGFLEALHGASSLQYKRLVWGYEDIIIKSKESV
jgi:hypothetical protein